MIMMSSYNELYFTYVHTNTGYCVNRQGYVNGNTGQLFIDDGEIVL